MNRNFKYTLWLLALLISMAVLSACQTKNKALNLQKQESSEKSEVKKAEESKLTDKSTAEKDTKESLSEQVKKKYAFQADSMKQDSKGNKTFYGVKGTGESESNKQEGKSTAEKSKNDINASHSAKSDSSGKSSAVSKSKIQNKQVKESVSAKFYGIGFLILVVLVALWYIKKQVKPVSKAADLFI